MSIAILATGNEIIQGDTLNTNSYHIAHYLNSEGLSLGLQLACEDEELSMAASIEFLCRSHSVIIITGGLGPTSDDLTRFALARVIHQDLVEHPSALAHIQARLSRASLSMNSGHHQQALFPPEATLIPNPNGTAMGCYCTVNEILFILLPGPPRECLPMFENSVVPLLQQTQRHGKPLLKWRIFGVAEGEIAHILDKALENIDCGIGYRIETPYVEFKVRCQPSRAAQIKKIVEPLIAAHIIATPEQKASQRLCSLLEQLSESIVIIDDATGGLLQTLLCQPQTYSKLRFHENKDAHLRFQITGLEEYWRQQKQSETSLTITYQNKDQKGSETHLIPYRNPLVVHYAVEYLSFRLFHLINKLHN